MSNEYLGFADRSPSDRFIPQDLARSSDLNQLGDDVDAGFDKLPAPAVLWGNRQFYVGASGGSSSAYTGTVATTHLVALTDGMCVRLRLHANNAAAATLNVNSLGAKSIKRADNSAIQANDLVSGGYYDFIYDGTNDVWKVPAISLAAGVGPQGAAGVDAIAPMFGDGSDGNVTISAGTTTLTRNMYYNNLTINGTGALDPAGFQVYVAGTLDLTAAPANAIRRSPNNGTNASAATGGAGATAISGSTTAGTGGAGSNGISGVSGAGSTATVSSATTAMMGGQGGDGGAGGISGAGQAGGAASANAALSPIVMQTVGTAMMAGVGVLATGGRGGTGGSSGGASTNSGGGGGGGGAGGAVLDIRAKYISRGTGTAAGAISARGGNGGNGGAPTAGNGRLRRRWRCGPVTRRIDHC